VDVEHLVAKRAGAAARDPAHQLRIAHFEQHHRIDRRAEVTHQPCQRFGLRLRTWEAIQDETLGRIGLRYAIADDLQHRGIVYQQALGHDGVRAFAELRAFAAVLAQDVASGYLRDCKLLDETLGLSALARSGRAHENDAHARFLTWIF
jgi:hypothetical protein